MHSNTIPQRAETLQVLRLMGPFEHILMLSGDDDGYGSRWTLSGQQVQPAIASFLMESGFIAEVGKTEFGAIKLNLTEKGREFREKGLVWWGELNFLESLRSGCLANVAGSAPSLSYRKIGLVMLEVVANDLQNEVSKFTV